MKRTFNLALFPLLVIFLSFSFFTSVDRTQIKSSITEIGTESSANDTFRIVSLYALGKIPLIGGTPDSISVRAVSQFPSAADKSIIVRVFNEENVHCCPYIDNDSCLSGNPKEIKIAEFPGASTFDTTISFQLGDFGLKSNDLIIVSGVYGDTLRPTDSHKTYFHKVTKDEWNYADPCLPDTAGLGFNGKTGNYLVSFRNKGSSNAIINSVDHTFLDSVGGGFKSYKIAVYADNGSGKPGSLLHLSSSLTTPAGTGTPHTVTYILSTPVTIAPGNKFYVGYRQTSVSNIKAAYQNENPVRKKAFFYSFPESSTTWYDFSDSSKNFRLDISPKIQSGQLTLKLNFEACPNTQAISVLLRNSTSPYAVADSVTGSGGGNATSNIYFGNAANGIPYYIEVKKVNAIETWSATPVSFSAGTSSFDFTTAISKAYGNNQKISGGIPSFYQGDVNQDGFVDGTDVISTYNNATVFVTGPTTDFNCDGTTDLSDIILAFNNSSNFVQRIRP